AWADPGLGIGDAIALKQAGGLGGHRTRVTCLAASGDGKTFVSGDANGTVKVWDASGTEKLSLAGPTRSVHSVVVSPDGLPAASVDDVDFKLWDLGSGKEKGGSIKLGSLVNVLSLTPDGKTLALAGGSISIYDAEGGKWKGYNVVSPAIRCTAITPDGKALVS